ncbi:ScyD/ScyE family protein [Nocardioides marmoribigeumensis]|uniref:ScyD/ScyE family protein n=1 Tax=Nocardioides marmoribigeumensis TaxID=433649 RepID=A0ABU2BR19_9ACTN|nr:ScyD/ScyE family protein [Nocardioides marmoribigeumensis]MDR7361066.1 hypothetical protein [Nocardioides marmoribigeumensis]
MTVLALGTAGAVVAAPATSTAAISGGGHGIVVASKLGDPFGLQSARAHRGLIVAENAGRVTRLFADGRKRTILSGVPGLAGVAGGPRRVFAVVGGPNEEGSPSGGKYGPSRVIRMTYNGKGKKVIANLLAYELKHNPDGQKQFVKGKPVDALSNPFAMTWSKYGLFVADGGANDVLKVNPATGKVSTFFVPPTVKDEKACKGPDANANPGTKGCDPVPTGVQVVGRDVFVSTLGAEAPSAGRVYRVDARSGKVRNVWTNLTAPTGVAVRRDGTVYFSQVLHGAPAGPPGPGFDPADVGRIVRIRNGHRTFAPVTMPTGLLLKRGVLYASSWSVGSFLGMKDAGKVVRVPDSLFHR